MSMPERDRGFDWEIKFRAKVTFRFVGAWSFGFVESGGSVVTSESVRISVERLFVIISDSTKHGLSRFIETVFSTPLTSSVKYLSFRFTTWYGPPYGGCNAERIASVRIKT